MNKKLFTAMAFALVAVVSCSDSGGSKKGGGTKVSPLSNEQKIKFSGTMDATYVAAKASSDLKEDEAAKPHAVRLNESINVNEKAEQLKMDMQQNCQMQMLGDEEPQFPQDPNVPVETNFSFTVSGSFCPVNLKMTTHQKINMSNFESTMNAFNSMKIVDPQTQQSLDLKEVEVTVNVSGNMQGANGSMKGFIDQPSIGRINLTGTMKSSGNENESVTTSVYKWQYPDFTAELTVNDTQKANSKGEAVRVLQCKLNGEEISEKECKLILQKSGFDESSSEEISEDDMSNEEESTY